MFENLDLLCFAHYPLVTELSIAFLLWYLTLKLTPEESLRTLFLKSSAQPFAFRNSKLTVNSVLKVLVISKKSWHENPYKNIRNHQSRPLHMTPCHCKMVRLASRSRNAAVIPRTRPARLHLRSITMPRRTRLTRLHLRSITLPRSAGTASMELAWHNGCNTRTCES